MPHPTKQKETFWNKDNLIKAYQVHKDNTRHIQYHT